MFSKEYMVDNSKEVIITKLRQQFLLGRQAPCRGGWEALPSLKDHTP